MTIGPRVRGILIHRGLILAVALLSGFLAFFFVDFCGPAGCGAGLPQYMRWLGLGLTFIAVGVNCGRGPIALLRFTCLASAFAGLLGLVPQITDRWSTSQPAGWILQTISVLLPAIVGLTVRRSVYRPMPRRWTLTLRAAATAGIAGFLIMFGYGLLAAPRECPTGSCIFSNISNGLQTN